MVAGHWESFALSFWFALASTSLSGCYAGAGPSFGFSVREARPTLGWEASAATVTVGQSLLIAPSTGESPQRVRVVRRTYLLWEPRYGALLGNEQDASGFGFIGGGPSVGMRWDKLNTPDARTQFGALGGVWAGGVYLPAGGSRDCNSNARAYVSIALGVRGSELYLTPKAGVAVLPAGCSQF